METADEKLNDKIALVQGKKLLQEAKVNEIQAHYLMGNHEYGEKLRAEAHALLDAQIDAVMELTRVIRRTR